MRLEYMMTADVQEAKEKNLPVILPIGTIEWHGPHCALGCDTMICQGFADKIAESKECVVCPPVWYGVASYAVGGPENGTVTIDVDVYENYIYGSLKSMLYGGFKNIYMLIHHQFDIITIYFNTVTENVFMRLCRPNIRLLFTSHRLRTKNKVGNILVNE